MRKPSQFLLSGYLAQASGIDNDFFKSIGNLFGGGDNSPAKAATAGDLIISVLQILLLIAASVAVIFLVVGGYQYITATGNDEKVEAAKKTLTGSILGLVIIVLAFAVVRIISAVLLQGGPSGTGIN